MQGCVGGQVDVENKTSQQVRAAFPECPSCDEPVDLASLAVNEQTTCPHCGACVLLVRLDGILMLLRDGWS